MNKIKKIQIFRLTVQLLMLIILPGLYIMAFSGLKEIISMLRSGNFNFLQALPSLVEFVSITALTILMGRFFCGWICAFGTFNDLVYMISKKLFRTNFRISEKMDSYLKKVKYVVLACILLVGSILGSTLFSNMSPWDAFAQLTDFPNILLTLPLGVLVLLLITIGSFFVERFFCRYLCPLGAFFTLVSGVGIFKINKPTDKCGKCRICTNNCSMGLPLYKAESVRGGECINCMKCVEACPRKNTCANVVNQDINPALASSVALSAFVGLYGISSLGGTLINQNNIEVSSNSAISSSVTNNAAASTNKSAAATSDSSSAKAYSNSAAGSSSSSIVATLPTDVQQGKYKDGTYTGSATGFKGGTTKVSVTVSGGKITTVKTLSTYDTPRFYAMCEQTIIGKILSSQSTSVDTVSGATYSSKGIANAVKNALSSATA